MKSNSKWCKDITKLLRLINFNVKQAAKRSISEITSRIRNVMKDEFTKGWKQYLNNDKRSDTSMGNKLRCYRTFKTDFCTEKYLLDCKNYTFRSNICRLRISCHKLFIETGKYLPKKARLKPEERICKFCNSGEVEDELHFLLRCNLYSDERSYLLCKISDLYKNFNELSDVMKFRVLLNSENKEIMWALGHYITSSFKKRGN